MQDEIMSGVIWGGGIVLLALACTAALTAGMMTQDMVLRLVLGMNGIVLAWYGNRLPKVVQPDPRARAAARLTGWALVAGGLANAGAFVFLTVDAAILWGTAAIALASVVTILIYAVLMLRMRG